MDLICPRCGEPMEFDTLHEEARVRQEQATEDNVIRSYDSVFSEVSSEWRSIGCNALHNIGASCTPAPEGSAMGNRALMASAAYEALGDDLDGAAAMLEDSGL